MNYDKTVSDIKEYLKNAYAPFIEGQTIDRLILTDRKDLLSALDNMTMAQLDEVLNKMQTDDYIQEDTGILITFKPSFILEE